MNVTGSSETKWFGQAVYEVEGYIILHSERPILGESQTAEKKERSWHSIGERDVEIVLDPQMTIAWRERGEIWKAVSSRIVTARTKIAREDGAMY